MMGLNELIQEIATDPFGTVPPLVLMVFLFWATFQFSGNKLDEATQKRQSEIATIFITITLILGVAAAFAKITIGLPPVWTLVTMAYLFMSLPMMAQLILFSDTKEEKA